MDAVEPEDGDLFKGKDHFSLKRMYMLAEEAQNPARILAFRDRDWNDSYDNDQWKDPEAEKQPLDVLRERGQDPATRNLIKRKINFLRGHEQRSRTDPRAFPRTPKHEDEARVATDCLDYIESSSRFDRTASSAFANLAIEGIEAAEVVVEGRKIVANLIAYEKFFYDPRSREGDFGDARYLGFADWWDADDAEDMLAGEDEAENERIHELLEETVEQGAEGDGWEDKPGGQWGDKDRRRVRLIVIYYRTAKGAWNYAYFTGAGVLKEGPSPYLDEEGNPTCAIIAQSCYVARGNHRFGAVRDMIPIQREVNHRLSASLNILKNRKLWQNHEGILDQNARTQAARPDGIITAKGGQKDVNWGFVDNTAEVAGNLELLQQALMGMGEQGPNAGLQGRGTENQSGIAIERQQLAGLTEENTLFDSHNDWKLRVYRAFWMRAKQYWTEADFIRVTDDEEAYRFVPINAPDTMRNRMLVQADGYVKRAQGAAKQQGMDWSHPGMDAPMSDQVINPLSQIDVDIIIEAAPDAITLQHEEFGKLAELASTGMVPIPPKVLLEASQLRDKRKLLEMMDQEQQAQAADPLKQIMVRLEVLERESKIKKTDSETAENYAGIEIDRAKLKIEGVKAVAGVAKTMQPQPQQAFGR